MEEKITQYFNQRIDEYIQWQKSESWSESYKWDILPRLSNELARFEHAELGTIDEIVSIYKSANPNEGTFIRYTYFADLEIGLQSDKQAVVDFMNSIWADDYENADRLLRTFAFNSRGLGTPGLGYFAAGRDPKRLPLFRGEFYDGFTKTLDISAPTASNSDKYRFYCSVIDTIATLMVPHLKSLGYSDDFTNYPAICAQDFLYHNFFNWTDNRLLHALQQFVAQADRNLSAPAGEADLSWKQYKMQYDKFKVTASFGQGGVSRVPWLGISFGSEYGFFPTFLYYADSHTLVLAFDHTEDSAPKYRWKNVEKYLTTTEYFAQKGQQARKFVNSRVFKAYDTTELLPVSLMDDLKEILAMYRQQLADIENQKEEDIDILSLVRRFVENADQKKSTTSEFKINYKGLESRAFFGASETRYMNIPWYAFCYSVKDQQQNGWNDSCIDLKYDTESNKLYLAYMWKNNGRETDAMQSSSDPRLSEMSPPIQDSDRVRKVYDPHDIPESFRGEFDQLIEEYKEQVKMKPKTESSSISIALNTILFGPPGTGKTYTAIHEYARDLLSKQSGQQVSAEEVLADSLKDLTWWQVVAITLYANPERSFKIREILDQQAVRSYLQFVKGRKEGKGYGTVATVLIERSDTESSNTPYRIEGQEFFHKNENLEWSLTAEGRAYVETELADVPTTAAAQQGVDWEKFYRTITFHQSYSYEEFVEGIRPKLDGDAGSIAYEVKDGIFKEMCDLAQSDPTNNYLLIIDEINRGNIAKIFGELITLLEEDKREKMRVQLPYSQKPFTVPKNLYVLGTMNTADRSIALLDIALRRRFEFVELMPNYETINREVDGINLGQLLGSINEKITVMIDRDHQIGHSYFMKVQNYDDLHRAWYKKVLPLMQEYFYNDWEKLETLLGKYKGSGKGFVESRIVSFPGNGDIDDNTLFDIHQYNPEELVVALKSLVENEETTNTYSV